MATDAVHAGGPRWSSGSSSSPTGSRTTRRIACGGAFGWSSTARATSTSSTEPFVSYWEIAGEHPVCSLHHTGESRALKLSDFVGLRQLKSSHVYAVWFGPCGIDRELNVAIPSPPWHTKTFLFERGRGSDFTERDRLRARSPAAPSRPPLAGSADPSRRLRAAALASLDESPSHDRPGVAPAGAAAGRTSSSHPQPPTVFSRSSSASRREARHPTPSSRGCDSGSPTFICRRGRDRLTIEPLERHALARAKARRARADLTRARRPRLGRAWEDQSPDRRDPLDLAEHGPQAPREHLREARGARQNGSGFRASSAS